jgi:hypothetical protein
MDGVVEKRGGKSDKFEGDLRKIETNVTIL